MELFANVLRRSQRRIPKPDQKEGFIRLFISKRLIHGAAAALAGIFVPIFLYETTGNSFAIVGGYYAMLSLGYALFLVPGMAVANTIGFSRTLVVSGLCSIFTYVTLFFMTPENVWATMWILAATIIAFRVFHWVPFHVDFALFTKAGERGKQVSLSFATIAFMGAIGPVLAGFIVENSGYNTLFAVILILLMAATVSYAYVPETSTKFVWTYKETLQQLSSPKLRGLAIGEFANGAEVIVNLVVWPIFLYEILNGDVLSIGLLSTFIVAVTIVLQLLLGRYLDGKHGSKEKTLRVGSVLYAVGWILKIFVLSAAQVFFVGLYHNIVKIFTKTPFSAIIYDMSADQGSLVDEYTVVREMSNHFGRAASLIAIAFLTLYLPLAWTFLIAAGASLALNMVYRIRLS